MLCGLTRQESALPQGDPTPATQDETSRSSKRWTMYRYYRRIAHVNTEAHIWKLPSLKSRQKQRDGKTRAFRSLGARESRSSSRGEGNSYIKQFRAGIEGRLRQLPICKHFLDGPALGDHFLEIPLEQSCPLSRSRSETNPFAGVQV